jgi:hypothetical protein
MKKFSWLIIILTVIVVWLIQTSFLSASHSFLSSWNLIVSLVIWLSFVSSPYWWIAASAGGFLLDLQQGIFGLNLLTLVCVALIVIYLRKHIATTGRISQFTLITLVSLFMNMLIFYILSWLFSKFNGPEFFNNWLIFGLVNLGKKIIFDLILNTAILSFIYTLYLRKIKLFMIR